MSKESQTSAALLQYDGKPSWGVAFPQAMQHVLAMLIGNITPPMLIAGTCGLSAEDQIMLTQAAMIIGGLTTLLQRLFPRPHRRFGHRLAIEPLGKLPDAAHILFHCGAASLLFLQLPGEGMKPRFRYS